jgi:hypothetical protein
MVLIHVRFVLLLRFRGEVIGLHPIQRETAGKVAENLLGNGVVEW